MGLLVEDAVVILSGEFSPLICSVDRGVADFSLALREEDSGSLRFYLPNEPINRLESVRALNDLIAQVRCQITTTSPHVVLARQL